MNQDAYIAQAYRIGRFLGMQYHDPTWPPAPELAETRGVIGVSPDFLFGSGSSAYSQPETSSTALATNQVSIISVLNRVVVQTGRLSKSWHVEFDGPVYGSYASMDTARTRIQILSHVMDLVANLVRDLAIIDPNSYVCPEDNLAAMRARELARELDHVYDRACRWLAKCEGYFHAISHHGTTSRFVLWIVEGVTAVLPFDVRSRYNEEFCAELAELSSQSWFRQSAYTLRLVTRCWSLRCALKNERVPAPGRSTDGQ